jgi:uncharacterized SAM-binding protein YcdF (DUF218 family)
MRSGAGAKMLMLLKAVFRNLILPPTGLLIVAIVGLLLSRRYRRLGTALLVFGLVSLWLCSTPVVANALERLTERYPPLDLSHPVNAQAVVILAGGLVRIAPEYGGPAASSQTLERLNYGAFVARRTSLPVLVSGTHMEAEAMQVTLSRDFGIRARWVDSRSGDTFQNAQFSAKLLHADGIHRIILVTNSTHEWRAAHEFMSAGLEVVPAPVGTLQDEGLRLMNFLPQIDALTQSNLAVYELIGDSARRLFAALHLRRQQSQN